MKIYGLIGKKLGHSFSKRYFTEKFERESIDARYELFELSEIADFQALWDNPLLVGVNVTIPYKEEVLPYLHELDDTALQVGAVNVVKRLPNGKLKGYNSDCIGFEAALAPLLPQMPAKALVLGTGGASKAVAFVLRKRQIPFYLVSRNTSPKNMGEIGVMPYESIDEAILEQCKLLINTTPLGMAPNTDALPPLPYSCLGNMHVCYDLVYNPENTQFMQQAAQQGAKVENGLGMLYGQAEAAWEIWNAKN
jgi:shikimate dehydrogenase